MRRAAVALVLVPIVAHSALSLVRLKRQERTDVFYSVRCSVGEEYRDTLVPPGEDTAQRFIVYEGPLGSYVRCTSYRADGSEASSRTWHLTRQSLCYLGSTGTLMCGVL